MSGGPERSGLWSATITVRRIVIDPVDVLLDLAAAERALWSWWAAHLGLPADEVLAAARERPLRDVVRQQDLARVRARREQLHRLVRRRRGASSLLRSIPAGRVAIWTTLEQEELSALEARARIVLPPARLCGLATDDDARAAAFLTEQGDEPSGWSALESHGAGAARSRRLGCRVVLVRPEEPRGTTPVPHAVEQGADRMVVEDPALLSVTPAADGLTVGIRRQARLLPGG